MTTEVIGGLHALNQVHALVVTAIDRALDDDQTERNLPTLRCTGWLILDALTAYPHGVRMGVFSTATGLSPGGLTRAADTLEAHGWITRDETVDDYRGRVMRLTPQGADMREWCRPIVSRTVSEVLSDPDHLRRTQGLRRVLPTLEVLS